MHHWKNFILQSKGMHFWKMPAHYVCRWFYLWSFPPHFVRLNMASTLLICFLRYTTLNIERSWFLHVVKLESAANPEHVGVCACMTAIVQRQAMDCRRCRMFALSDLLWLTVLSYQQHHHPTFWPISCIGLKFTRMSVHSGADVERASHGKWSVLVEFEKHHHAQAPYISVVNKLRLYISKRFHRQLCEDGHG